MVSKPYDLNFVWFVGMKTIGDFIRSTLHSACNFIGNFPLSLTSSNFAFFFPNGSYYRIYLRLMKKKYRVFLRLTQTTYDIESIKFLHCIIMPTKEALRKRHIFAIFNCTSIRATTSACHSYLGCTTFEAHPLARFSVYLVLSRQCRWSP